MFNMIRNCQTAYQSGFTTLCHHQKYVRILVASYLPKFVTLKLFNLSHSSGCVWCFIFKMICISLMIDNAGYFSCVLLGLSNIFLYEASAQVLLVYDF